MIIQKKRVISSILSIICIREQFHQILVFYQLLTRIRIHQWKSNYIIMTQVVLPSNINDEKFTKFFYGGDILILFKIIFNTYRIPT